MNAARHKLGLNDLWSQYQASNFFNNLFYYYFVNYLMSHGKHYSQTISGIYTKQTVQQTENQPQGCMA